MSFFADPRLAFAAFLASCAPLIGCTGPGLCVHGNNWKYKIGTDEQVRAVSLEPVPTTIDELRSHPHGEHTNGRVAPVETTTWLLRDVELRSFQRAPDGDVHMVVADEHGHTIIIEAAPPFCAERTSPWFSDISEVRKVVDAEIPMSLMGWRTRTISLAGVGYFDFIHAQFGVAPNGIELHPVLAICFGRGCALPDPRASRTTIAHRGQGTDSVCQ